MPHTSSLVRTFIICLVLLLSTSGMPAIVQSPVFALSDSFLTPSTSVDLETGRVWADAQPALDHLPLYFVENRGQLDAEMAYSVLGGGTQVYFTRSGVTFAPSAGHAQEQSRTNDKWLALLGVDRGRDPASTFPASELPPSSDWAVKLEFVGADPQVQPAGQALNKAVVSYFRGPQEAWRTGLRTFSSVLYSELWPGIDLVYRGTAGKLKYEFVVKPGADPGQIRLAYRGANALRVDESGQLLVSTPLGELVDGAPLAWQDHDGRRTAVDMRYQLEPKPPGSTAGARDGSATYGFQIGAYDHTRTLVLDPVLLVYCGYIGGNSDDDGHGIAVDTAGHAYVTGTTASMDFPATEGSAHWNRDAFFAKITLDGTELEYAGFIGGEGYDDGNDIALDGLGNAYIVGLTSSGEDFPVKNGPDGIFNGGGSDAFVAKVNPNGTELVYAGYIGGSGDDIGAGIAVDAVGNAYVTGHTSSDESTFPKTVGPDLEYNGALFDAFVAKVDPEGTALLYAGYIGGAGIDYGRDVAVDAAGNAYVTGETSSEQKTFPVQIGPDLAYNGGENDAFVAKVDPEGTALLYAGYIGGSSVDTGDGLAVDAAGNAYITGKTSSSEASFPDKVGPDRTYNGGKHDAFVAKVDAAGALFYAGYIGGSGDDFGAGIAVDAAGNTYIAGSTNSDETTFPVKIGPGETYNGNLTCGIAPEIHPCFDAFVASVTASGAGLAYAGYVGGTGDDWGGGIAVDASGDTYITGSTNSSEATFPVKLGPDVIYTDNLTCGTAPDTYPCFDAFVAKIHTTYKVYLPMVIRSLPPPHLNPIPAPESQPKYTVSWSAEPPHDSYVLEEAADPGFTDDLRQIYPGGNTSQEIDSRGIRRYYYRVKANGSTEDSNWSNTQWVDVRWEEEPNGNADEANGPLAFGLPYYGRPNDSFDVFHFEIESGAQGTIGVDLTNYYGINPQLLLYYDYGPPRGIEEVAKVYTFDQPPNDLHLKYKASLSGHYYVLVFAPSGFNTETVYTIKVSFP
jgi:hypothetical protein